MVVPRDGFTTSAYVFLNHGDELGWQRRTKRLLDLALIAAAAPILVPVAAATTVAVRAKMGAPVLFKQHRIGLNEQVIIVYKFRSMLDLTGPNGEPLADIERITQFGTLLRKTSLDEIPQLWSVLKGDLSLVGPRPLLVEYLPYYRERERLRHTVPPGLTGLAQVSGRNHLGWDERLELDAQYSEDPSIRRDLRILARTLVKLARGSDVVVVPSTIGQKLDVERSAVANVPEGGAP